MWFELQCCHSFGCRGTVESCCGDAQATGNNGFQSILVPFFILSERPYTVNVQGMANPLKSLKECFKNSSTVGGP